MKKIPFRFCETGFLFAEGRKMGDREGEDKVKMDEKFADIIL